MNSVSRYVNLQKEEIQRLKRSREELENQRKSIEIFITHPFYQRFSGIGDLIREATEILDEVIKRIEAVETEIKTYRNNITEVCL